MQWGDGGDRRSWSANYKQLSAQWRTYVVSNKKLTRCLLMTPKFWVVGFDAGQQQILYEFHWSNWPVQLLSCEESSTSGRGLCDNAQEQHSDSGVSKKLDAAALKVDALPKGVSLEHLEGLDVFDWVTVNIKVVKTSIARTSLCKKCDVCLCIGYYFGVFHTRSKY